MMLTRESLLATSDLKPIEVEVPGTRETIFLRRPTVREWRDLVVLQTAADGDMPPADAMAAVIATVVVDANGERLFSNADIAALAEQHAEKIVPIYKACLPVIAITQQVEDFEKKS